MQNELIDYSETVPIQYERGRVEFMGMEVAVDPRVLIPRPETELLVDVTVALCNHKIYFDPFILEIGTGSGVIPMALRKNIAGCTVTATDISEEALQVARKNVCDHGMSGIEFVLTDMFEGILPEYEERFDVLVSNPPYVSEKDYSKVDAWVKAEPRIALCSGKEGMDHLKIMIENGNRCLRPGGFIALEIGYDQSEKVKGLFDLHGYHNISSHKDHNGYERVITGFKNG